jgi:D-sedoheptulose 7-phosphate isomerase
VKLDQAHQIIQDAIVRDGQIFACGNGGSAAIANHLQCDHAKGISTLTALHPRIQSLSANIEIVTAIGNDLDFTEIFSQQLANAARPGDALIAISSSGNSPNICRALAWARSNGLQTISFTGFTGGKAASLADVNIHVDAENYGVVEDVHQTLMHALAQFVRMSHMDEQTIPGAKF